MLKSQMIKFPLINRTHYSIHRAFSKPAELAKAAKEAGFTHCGLCDWGNISGAVEFYESCQKHEVVPVIGCDLGGNRVFALNKNGWNELIKVVTAFCCDGFLNRDSLACPDLIVVDGAYHDCRYIDRDDQDMYALVRALGEKVQTSSLDEPTGGYHFPSSEEIPDSPVYSTIVERSSPYTILGAPKLPHFDSGGISEIDALKRLVERGFKNKLESVDPDMIQTYRDRVTYEMRVIELAELAGYFLIVQDFVAKARKDKQLCSIGRGSAAGSLVSYLIGITLIDPIPYGLLFSRFFNAARAYPKHLSFDEHKFIDEWRDFESKLKVKR